MLLDIKKWRNRMKAKKTMAILIVALMAFWVPHCDLINGEDDDDSATALLLLALANQATINVTNNTGSAVTLSIWSTDSGGTSCVSQVADMGSLTASGGSGSAQVAPASNGYLVKVNGTCQFPTDLGKQAQTYSCTVDAGPTIVCP
tara:strand:+ start:493 stop:930 length:438 start_codon:yes stop_codon:yes gene_type:complete